jgi:hypothetical protein
MQPDSSTISVTVNGVTHQAEVEARLLLAYFPPRLPQRTVPRPWREETPEALPYPILRRLSRPRLAALRLAASCGGVRPPRAGGAASAASTQRPPVEAGGGSGGANKWLWISYPLSRGVMPGGLSIGVFDHCRRDYVMAQEGWSTT